LSRRRAKRGSTHFAAALPVAELGRRIASASDQAVIVSNVLAMLIRGY
jgi:hypothetical protein